MLRPIYPDAKRGLQMQGHQYTSKRVPDVEHTPFWIEAQQAKRLTIPAKLNQAGRDRALAEDERPILVITREDGCSALATLFFDDLLALLKANKVNESYLSIPIPSNESKLVLPVVPLTPKARLEAIQTRLHFAVQGITTLIKEAELAEQAARQHALPFTEGT